MFVRILIHVCSWLNYLKKSLILTEYVKISIFQKLFSKISTNEFALSSLVTNELFNEKCPFFVFQTPSTAQTYWDMTRSCREGKLDYRNKWFLCKRISYQLSWIQDSTDNLAENIRFEKVEFRISKKYFLSSEDQK